MNLTFKVINFITSRIKFFIFLVVIFLFVAAMAIVSYYFWPEISSGIDKLAGKSAEQIPNEEWKACAVDADCVETQVDCCDCGHGGIQLGINKQYIEQWQAVLKKKCQDISCIAMFNCKDGKAVCENSKCVFKEDAGLNISDNLDSDSDGLMNLDEAEYNTDPNNPDSDGDGYSDREEINNGYNPMGEGKLNGIDLFPIEIDKKYGFINKIGMIIIEPKFDYSEDFYDGLAYVKIVNKKGFIDDTGKMIFEMPEKTGKHNFGEFPDGLLAIFTETNDGWGAENYGFINKEGEISIPQQYDEANDFSEGLAEVCKKFKETDEKTDWQCGFIDTTGKMIFKTGFGAKNFSEGLAAVCVSEGKCGYIDKTGKIVIEPQFANVGNFSEGLAAVRDKSLDNWGFIDKTGKMVIEPKFSGVEDFSDGLAVAQNGSGENGKDGFIDKTGNFVIEPLFYSADSFKDGLAQVAVGSRDSQKDFFIDKNGKTVITLDSPQGVYYKFDDFQPYRNGLFRIFIYASESNDELGMKYVNKTGRVVWSNQREAKQQIAPNGEACPETISTATLKELSGALVLVMDNNCQTLADKLGAQSVFDMDTNGREAVKASLKKYGIMVDQNFDEKKDTEGWAKICMDYEGELICSPVSLYKDNNGNWIVTKM